MNDDTALVPPPPLSPALQRLLTDFQDRRPAALARAVSIVENHRPGFEALMSAIHPSLGRARRIGITGPPGAGKSTLTALLAAAYRERGLTVGIVAIDPTSPFTGGALLGDRIRMERIVLDPGIFIRSLATRGSLGGLSRATREVSDVVDAFGFDRILIETVGVGQSELDVARTADTTMVVLVPESGDSIQTLKAGLMEIADLFVVNKSDRPGADRLRSDIEVMLGIRSGSASDAPAHHGVELRRFLNPARAAREAAAASGGADTPGTEGAGWTPPVLRTIAAEEKGIDELVAALDRHHDYLVRSGTLRDRRLVRLRERVVETVEHRVQRRLWGNPETNAWLDRQLPALDRGELTPFMVADELLARSADLLTRTDS